MPEPKANKLKGQNKKTACKCEFPSGCFCSHASTRRQKVPLSPGWGGHGQGHEIQGESHVLLLIPDAIDFATGFVSFTALAQATQRFRVTHGQVSCSGELLRGE